MSFVSVLRGLYRSILVVIHLACGLFLATILRITRGDRWHHSVLGQHTICWWSARACRVIGVRITCRGIPVERPALLVANHISWIEIIAIASLLPARFVAKAELRNWPLIGALAAMTGTVFIRRRYLSGLLHTLSTATRALNAGQTLVAFPEATTSAGDRVGEFHGALFQAAINTCAVTQAIAVHYSDAHAAFIDDAPFAAHLLRLLCRPTTQVWLSFCQPIACDGRERRDLAGETRAQIVRQLDHSPMRAQTWPPTAAIQPPAKPHVAVFNIAPTANHDDANHPQCCGGDDRPARLQTPQEH